MDDYAYQVNKIFKKNRQWINKWADQYLTNKTSEYQIKFIRSYSRAFYQYYFQVDKSNFNDYKMYSAYEIYVLRKAIEVFNIDYELNMVNEMISNKVYTGRSLNWLDRKWKEVCQIIKWPYYPTKLWIGNIAKHNAALMIQRKFKIYQRNQAASKIQRWFLSYYYHPNHQGDSRKGFDILHKHFISQIFKLKNNNCL